MKPSTPRRKGPKPGTPRKLRLVDQPALVRKMHREHLGGLYLRDLQRKHGYMDGNIKNAFVRLGLEVKLCPTLGHYERTLHRHSREEILALVEQTRRIVVPPALRTEWREWTMEKRWWLIQALIKKHGMPYELPKGPYSANVVPFHYGTPAAHETAAKVNAGLNSRQWLCHLKIMSRGVIYDGHLWSYVPDNGYVRGQFKKGEGRKVLHREIYKAHHGEIPAGCVVRFIDGNENNLDPANLRLATRNDLARENQAKHFTSISRRKLQALLKHGTVKLPKAA
ncbi:MAG: HNH endonuclease [Verrucomicrobiaceae bacterium]|nr:HNH endonuclease [Verrucomicrobiaceae bacterium]